MGTELISLKTDSDYNWQCAKQNGSNRINPYFWRNCSLIVTQTGGRWTYNLATEVFTKVWFLPEKEQRSRSEVYRNTSELDTVIGDNVKIGTKYFGRYEKPWPKRVVLIWQDVMDKGSTPFTSTI